MKSFAVGALAIAARFATPALSADAPPPVPARAPATVPILPLASVRPGMTGYGLTVFRGTKPERFTVRVVSVLRNFLPKQDVILVRAEDARLEFSGIVAGMSGSPIYIDGRLMGALAYAWNFSKEPLAGVTPIESMLAEKNRPRHAELVRVASLGGAGPPVMTVAEGGSPSDLGGALEGSTAAEAVGSRGPDERSGSDELRPATLALTIAGVSARVISEFAPDFTAVGLHAVQGGGGRSSGSESQADGTVRVGGVTAAPASAARASRVADAPHRLEPGSAVGVELVRGDMSAVGTGTVTYVEGNDVLAFGHPMMGIGEVYLPLVDAEIHAILPSLSQSLKLSSPIHEVGSLVQDRQAGIVGDLGFRTSMIPVIVRVATPQAPLRTFSAEIARNRRLTPTLAALVATSAITDADPSVTDAMLTIESKLWVRGLPPIVLEDRMFSNEGLSRSALLGSRGMRAVSQLLSNPFQPVVLERMEIDVGVTYRRDVSEIVAVAAPGGRVRAGDTVRLRVTMRPFDGVEYTELVPVVVPITAAGEAVRIEVVSGASTRPEVAPAESLSGYVENLQAAYSPFAIVVSIARPDDGVALRGRLLPSLPGAAFDTLRPSSQARRSDGYRISERIVHPTSHLVSGKQEVSLWVTDDAIAAGSR